MHSEKITSVNGTLLALLIRDQPTPPARGREPGLHFFTGENDQLQVAAMTRPAGEKIAAHYHTPVQRKVWGTPEVIFIRRGRLKAVFYNTDETACASRELRSGDILILLAGGHGFEALEETEMYEVKQGPYLGAEDKVRFIPRELPEHEPGVNPDGYEW